MAGRLAPCLSPSSRSHPCIFCSSPTRKESCTRCAMVCIHHTTPAELYAPDVKTVSQSHTVTLPVDTARNTTEFALVTVSRHGCQLPRECQRLRDALGGPRRSAGYPTTSPLLASCDMLCYMATTMRACRTATAETEPLAIPRMPDLSKSGAFPPSLHGLLWLSISNCLFE